LNQGISDLMFTDAHIRSLKNHSALSAIFTDQFIKGSWVSL
jgi:hypothetical protein